LVRVIDLIIRPVIKQKRQINWWIIIIIRQIITEELIKLVIIAMVESSCFQMHQIDLLLMVMVIVMVVVIEFKFVLIILVMFIVKEVLHQGPISQLLLVA
jgi:hypothetical protein